MPRRADEFEGEIPRRLPRELTTFGRAVAENVRRIRSEKGLSQAALATVLSATGSRWSKSNVAALERGSRQQVTAGEMIELAAALNVPVRDLYEGAGDLALGEDGHISREKTREAFSSRKVPDPAVDEVVVAFAAMGDVLAVEVAERLGADVASVQAAAHQLFRRTVTQERARRVGDDLDPESRSAVTRRGNHTRAITAQIGEYLEGRSHS